MLAGPGKIYCTFGTRSAATVILVQHLSRGNIAAEIFIESDPNISSLNDPAYKSSIPIVYKRVAGVRSCIPIDGIIGIVLHNAAIYPSHG